MATVLAGIRLVADPRASFFPVLNMVILWLVVRSAALAYAAMRCKAPLQGFFFLSAVTDFLLAVLLLAGIPIALVVAGLFGQTSEIIETFAWVLAASFVATGVLLICDAWFDVLTAHGDDQVWSVVTALVVELPLAAVLIAGSMQILRLVAARLAALDAGAHTWQVRIPLPSDADTAVRRRPARVR